MASRSATVLVIFVVAVFAFCLASVFASMTGTISILPNNTQSYGILDNLSAISENNSTNYDNYNYQTYDDTSDEDSGDDDSKDVETTKDTKPKNNPKSKSSSQDSDSSDSDVETITDASSSSDDDSSVEITTG